MNDKRPRTRPQYLAHAAVCVACIIATLCAGLAHAEDSSKSPRAILLAVGGHPASAAPMNAVIHAELEELHVVTVVAALGLDLAAVQLSIDCVSETPRCLKAVAAQERAQVLISPTLQHSPNAIVLSILRFDTREGELRRVTRRQTGTNLGPDLLDSVPNMLRELFDLPLLPASPAARSIAKAELPPSAARNHKPVTVSPPEPRKTGGLPAGPLVLAGAGVVSLASALSVGVVMKDTQKDYDRIRDSLDTKAEAQAAVDTRSRGKTEATVANVLFAVGGGALASGIVWLALDLSGRKDKETSTLSLSPILSPSRVGLMLTKRGAGL
ncbi:MAG TPA: hypothetical protein VFN67_08630 [Polyangiales bacterium]|nr:hypothetical protein [Polyangiales bacterium]